VFTYPCDVRENGNYQEFDKLSFDDMDLKYDYLYLVRHSDIDFIGHMNNTRYADSLRINGVVKHFEINYLHEVKLDEILFIKHDESKFVGYNGATVSFKALCEYFEGE
jgi:acyl-CoA thioesterase FadM